LPVHAMCPRRSLPRRALPWASRWTLTAFTGRITRASGTVMKLPLTGGSSHDTRVRRPSPGHRIGCTSVYYTIAGNTSLGDGALGKMPLAGGTHTKLSSGENSPSAVAVDATNVYWATADEVRKIPLVGGTGYTTLASGQSLSPPWRWTLPACTGRFAAPTTAA